MKGWVDLVQALFAIALPILLAIAAYLGTALIIWVDSRWCGRRLSVTADIARKLALQGDTQRFGELRRLTIGYVLWALGNGGVQAVLLHRMARFFLLHRARLVADVVRRIGEVVTGVELSPHAIVGRGLVIHHGRGAVIGKGSCLGNIVTIYQGVTTGSGRPSIGDEAILWPGSKVLGDVTIGCRAEVGANAVVLTDVPPDTVAVGVPARWYGRGARSQPLGD
jgi:serine acetyltransferase